MTYRNSTYTAFYVVESQIDEHLGAYFAEDFCYYRMLKSWKRNEWQFPFIDAHGKTYNVRDDSDWESTLKPRLHERLRMSKNIILILGDKTKQSKALREEIVYGIDSLGLPVIVAYPELEFVGHENKLSERATARWDNLPAFKDRIGKVPTVHIPFKKDYFERALTDPRFSVVTKSDNCCIGLNSKYGLEMREFTNKLFVQFKQDPQVRVSIF